MIHKIQKVHAILALDENAKVRVIEDDVANISEVTWLDDNPNNITEEQIATKLAELQAEYDALDYARTREKAYPQLKEFAEAYTEKEIGGDDTKWNEYVTKYNKVRTDNPKG